MNPPRVLALATAAACVMLAGCVHGPVGPNYVAPAALTAAQSASAGPFLSGGAATSDATMPAHWWRLYEDPQLDGLISRALAHNSDLRQALATFERAMAVEAEARGSKQPSISLSGGPSFGFAQRIQHSAFESRDFAASRCFDLGDARQMLSLIDQLFHDIDAQEVSGSIRIGAIEHYATRVLPALIAEFCKLHPRIHVELQHGVSSLMHRELGARYDLVIGIGPVGSGEGLRLSKSRVVWASTAGSATHLQRPLPLALNPEGAMLRDWATHALDQAGIPWRIAYTSTTVTGLEAAVRAGIAIGVFREATISQRLKVLGAREGMPAMPECEVWLAATPGPGRKAVELLEAFLIHKLRKARR